MSDSVTRQNKQIVRQLFEEGFNRDQLALVDELVAEEYVDATGERGPAAFKAVITRLRSAFPDIHYTIEDMLAEDDRVALRWHLSGTHRGPFRGIAPTERELVNNGSAIFKLRAGRVIAAALDTDRLGFLQSIGVVAPTDQLFPPLGRSAA